MIKQATRDLFYYIPAAVPSAIAALQMAEEIRVNYEYGGAYLAPVVGVFLSVLFVLVGKSVGVGFANALTSNDKPLTILFLLGLIGYGIGEWWVNPLAAGQVASAFVVAFYVAVPLARIVESRAIEAAAVRSSAVKVQVAEQNVAEARLQLELREFQVAKRDVGKRSAIVPAERNAERNGTERGTERNGTMERVFDHLQANPGASYATISDALSVSKSTVSRNVAKLTAEGRVNGKTG